MCNKFFLYSKAKIIFLNNIISGVINISYIYTVKKDKCKNVKFSSTQYITRVTYAYHMICIYKKGISPLLVYHNNFYSFSIHYGVKVQTYDK